MVSNRPGRFWYDPQSSTSIYLQERHIKISSSNVLSIWKNDCKKRRL